MKAIFVSALIAATQGVQLKGEDAPVTVDTTGAEPTTETGSGCGYFGGWGYGGCGGWGGYGGCGYRRWGYGGCGYRPYYGGCGYRRWGGCW